MKIIGLTGGTGAGKSMLAEHYRKRGGYIIDADKLSHQVILKGAPESAYDTIAGYFGDQILDKDGEINRRRLGDLVFNRPDDLAFLVQIIHRHVVQKTNRLIENAPADAAFILIDAPLLVEADMHKICHQVIVVSAAQDIRIKRVMQRDHKSYEAVQNIIKNQMPFTQLQKYADYVIYTDGEANEVLEKADEVLNSILVQCHCSSQVELDEKGTIERCEKGEK